MHGFLCAPEDTPYLAAELTDAGAPPDPTPAAPGLLTLATALPPAFVDLALVFLRQWLPEVQSVQATSIRLWAERVVEAVQVGCPPGQPWRLHIVPHYQTVNSTHAGEHRCRLIFEAVLDQLSRRARAFRRSLQSPNTGPFAEGESLIQLILTEPEKGWLSVAPAPLPARSHRRLSPFPAGEIPVASDLAAPSRAFAKLLEAELRLGRSIAPGDTCVDLGACPGSWSYVAIHRGASVVSVDRSPVRDDLLRHPRLRFHQGDAFKYQPDSPVDWLLCDVIAAPERSIQLVLDWVRAGWCRHFVVTIKFKGHDQYRLLDPLKRELPLLTADYGLARLCANKNEACVFGSVAKS